MALLVLFGFSVSAFATELDNALKEKEKLESQLNDTKDEINDLQDTKDELEDYVENLDAKLSEATNSISKLESQLNEKKTLLEEEKQKLEAATKQKDLQYNAMRKRIKFMYENGNTSVIEAIIESGSIAEMLNKLLYIQEVADYDKKLFDDLQNTVNEISESTKIIESEYNEIMSMQKELINQKKSLDSLIKQKENEVNKYLNEIEDKEKLAAIFEGEIKAQNEAIELIRAELAKENTDQKPENTPESGGNGRFVWPCPASRVISGYYGYRDIPIEGASANHNGIDIAAPYGSDIVAAASGTVIIARYSATAGNWVIINHGNGVCSVYMHASSLLVSEGQYVSQGQTIAKVGSTGLSTGNHLHFGVSENGSYVNPWNYL